MVAGFDSRIFSPYRGFHFTQPATIPVNMRALIFLAAVAMASAAFTFPDRPGDEPHKPVPPHQPSYGYLTEYDVRNLVESLEKKVNLLDGRLSHEETQVAIIQGRINYLKDNLVTFLATSNANQDGLIASYRQQVKDLRHRVDAASAKAAQASSIAEDVKTTLDEYIGDVDDIETADESQNSTIYDLAHTVYYKKYDFLVSLNETYYELIEHLDEVDGYIQKLKHFIQFRNCETASSFVALEDYKDQEKIFIPFGSYYAYKPTVALFTSGFNVHTDKDSYDYYNGISLDKYLHEVNTTGFVIAAKDLSEGMVDVKNIFCSWMVCQYLDETFSVDH